MIKAAGLLTVLLAGAAPQSATENLLLNGDARRADLGWTRHGEATIDMFLGVPSFTIRWKGSFTQEATLSNRHTGMYAAVVARGQSDRINADGSITGLPYLWAMVVRKDRKRVLAYWQGQNMLATPRSAAAWVPMSGVFKVPEGTRHVMLRLGQAERKDSPQDGSVARFTDVRLHLFSAEDDARAFVDRYRTSAASPRP